MGETDQNAMKKLEATLVFSDSWKAEQEGDDFHEICNEDIIQWALKYKLGSEGILRKYADELMPKGSQKLIYPNWKTQELEELKNLIAKYWLWLFMLDDKLEKITQEEIEKFSLQFSS